MFRRLRILIPFLLTAAACSKDPLPPEPVPLLQVPQGFPDPVFPEDNTLSEIRWTLGKKLFFDPIMSRDSTVSCASCHLPQYAFSDTIAFSRGVGGAPGVRNAPTLGNVAYHPYYLREGSLPTLEMQILVPVQEHVEFDFNMLLIAERMKRDTAYTRMSWEAYDRQPQPFVITRAIATFERTMLTGNSRYDRYLFQGKTGALTAAELRGMDLFFSDEAGCGNCHGGFNFTLYAFENNGLYAEYPDPGRFRFTGLEEDRARFKTPSLRNVALTAPYMHDGSIKTLDAVVAHYNAGGAAHPNKSALVRPLGLTEQERADLLAFLHSLTDDQFIKDPRFQK